MPTTLHTPIEPSRIGLGTASFGSDISQDRSFAVMDAYAEAGGNFIDTAHIYAAWREGGWGASERTVGTWIRARGVRNQIVLATKGAHPPMDDLSHGRGSRTDIEQDLNESLDRLGVEHIDLYWLHRDDPARPVGEIVETLASLAADGRIRSYGGSNWTVPRLDAANQYAATHGLPPMVASQPGWALARRASSVSPVPGMLYLDDEGVRWHEQSGLPVAAYTAQARGYFGKENGTWARQGFSGTAPRGAEYDGPESRQKLLAAMAIGDRKGCTTNQVALAWLMHHAFPVYPIVGTSVPERAQEAVAAMNIELLEDDLTALRP